MTDAATTTATGRPLAVVVLVGEAEHGDPWHALDQTGRRVAEVIADELGEAVSVRVTSTSDDAETLLDEADVAVVHGSAFGLGPYLRIAYALDDESLRKACEAIRQFCNALR